MLLGEIATRCLSTQCWWELCELQSWPHNDERKTTPLSQCHPFQLLSLLNCIPSSNSQQLFYLLIASDSSLLSSLLLSALPPRDNSSLLTTPSPHHSALPSSIFRLPPPINCALFFPTKKPYKTLSKVQSFISLSLSIEQTYYVKQQQEDPLSQFVIEITCIKKC